MKQTTKTDMDMLLPITKDDFIEMIAQGNADAYRRHCQSYGERECHSISSWTLDNFYDLTDIEEFHNMFDEIDDELFERWGEHYTKRAYTIIQWALNRYINEIDNRISELI